MEGLHRQRERRKRINQPRVSERKKAKKENERVEGGHKG